MFDPAMYNVVFQAINEILRRNIHQFGREFCDSLMAQYDPNNGPASQNNAQNLLNLLNTEALNASGGQSSRITQEQLFSWLGQFIQFNFQKYAQATQSQNRGGGFGFNNNGGGFGGAGFGSQQRGSGFGMNSGFGSGGFGQSPRPSVGSGFGDVVEPIGSRAPQPQAQQQQPTPQPQATSSAPMQSMFSVQQTAEPSVGYNPNPLDEVSEGGVEFKPVTSSLDWGGEMASDNRIIVARREELKTTSAKFTVNYITAFHQYIQDDPMDVLRDFFKVVPDSTLGNPFLTKIVYHHLEVLNLPTAEFVAIREKCIAEMRENRHVIMHKLIGSVLDTMQRGPYKILESYLVKEVNRALHLAARLSTDAENYVKIGAFEDIDDLLSSSFVHPFTTLPEGRHKLDVIVGSALWNALVMNTDVMFADDDKSFPTHAVQMSPAFPHSMDGVYPNKFAIPLDSEESMTAFRQRLQERELSRKTYLISRRSVVVTNIFGKKVLPQIGDTPKVISTPLSQVIARVAAPYAKMVITGRDVMRDESLLVSEVNPSDQLAQYYEDPQEAVKSEIEKYSRIAKVDLPLDQTIFAIQYGVDPTKYMKAIDVFTTLDETLGQGQTILANKEVPELTITA